MDARCCVVCRGLDIGNCVSFSQFWLILTGMHKLAGNHASVAHVVTVNVDDLKEKGCTLVFCVGDLCVCLKFCLQWLFVSNF